MTPTSGSPWGDDYTNRPDGGDGLPGDTFDDDIEGDGFDDDPFGLRARPAATGGESAFDDEGTAEPVLYGEDEENVPNAYNVRNIVLIATGGFVLVLVAFLFSLGGSPDPDALAEAQRNARGLPTPAQAPQMEIPYGEPADDDLQDLLNDGSFDNPPPYASAAPAPSSRQRYYDQPPPSSSGPRKMTYLEERRQQFLAALGLGSRRNVADQPAAPQEPYYGGPVPSYTDGGQPVYDGSVQTVGADGSAPYAAQAFAQGGQGGYAAQAAGGQARQQSAASRRQRGGPPSGFRPGGGVRQASVQAQPAFAPFVLARGSLIPITLETAVDSDIPGVMIARTTADVLDRTRRHVIIPRGSQVFTSYDSGGVTGDRLTFRVERLNLPDGRSVDFTSAKVHDPQGNIGLTDQVIRHIPSKTLNGALAIAGGIAEGLAIRRERTIIYNADGSQSVLPSASEAGYEAASRGARGANNAIEAATRPALTRPNTVRLRSGLRGMIILSEDIDMLQPYFSTGGPVATGASPHDTRPSPLRGLRRATTPGRPNIPPPPPVRTNTRTVSRR